MPPQQPIELGRRIVVWGATGSGKTTVSRRIGEALGLGVIELDGLRHANGWNATEWPEMRRLLNERLDSHTDGWVTDGSYSHVSDLYLATADTLIWLRLPWRTSFWRLLKRTLRRAWTREPLYHAAGPRESWRMIFLSRESILWWSISHHRTALHNFRRRIAALPPHVRVHELRSPREVSDFLATLPVRTETQTPRH